MKRVFQVVAIASIALTSTAYIAQSDGHSGVDARKAVMKQIGGAAKTLGGMARGQSDYNAAKAAEASASLLEASQMIVVAFEANVIEGRTKAKPLIWEDFEDFSAKAADLKAGAQMAVASTNLNGLKAAMGAIGATCGACHKVYRN